MPNLYTSLLARRNGTGTLAPKQQRLPIPKKTELLSQDKFNESICDEYKGVLDEIVAPPTRSIGIIGAGLAGLSAAYELRKRGYSVSIFEASERPGGRTWARHHLVKRHVMDGGAELIGSNHPLWLNYADTFRLGFSDVKEYDNCPILLGKKLLSPRREDSLLELIDIHQHHSLGRKSLRHNKSLMGTIFSHAKNSGLLDGINPTRDARIPKAAKPSTPTHAYSPQEVFAFLNVLTGVAKTAIGLMYFAGLRPGEARGIRWSDFDGKLLKIRQSMWRLHLSEPKTEASVASVPVCQTLRELLNESPRRSEFILCSANGRPLDLHNLASREIVPRLRRCGKCDKEKEGHDGGAGHAFEQLPKWRGYYSLRRGCATLATSLDSALAAKGLLRHSDIATTSKHYIKDIPSETLRAAEKMDALFLHRSGSAPN